jgi:gamma-glutamylaminecyclotransferase
MTATEFSKIALCCANQLRDQHNPQVAQAFVQLLDRLRQLTEISGVDQVDRFDHRKGLEQEVDQLLIELAAQHAASMENRGGSAVQTGPAKPRSVRTTRLFVYGTLKRGFSRSETLTGQRFLGVARTVAAYRLYDCGAYPGLVEDPQGAEITGELWEVDVPSLARLDDVEGVSQNLYRRGTVRLQATVDSYETAESYFYQRSVQGLRDCGSSWP